MVKLQKDFFKHVYNVTESFSISTTLPHISQSFWLTCNPNSFLSHILSLPLLWGRGASIVHSATTFFYYYHTHKTKTLEPAEFILAHEFFQVSVPGSSTLLLWQCTSERKIVVEENTLFLASRKQRQRKGVEFQYLLWGCLLTEWLPSIVSTLTRYLHLPIASRLVSKPSLFGPLGYKSHPHYGSDLWSYKKYNNILATWNFLFSGRENVYFLK